MWMIPMLHLDPHSYVALDQDGRSKGHDPTGCSMLSWRMLSNSSNLQHPNRLDLWNDKTLDYLGEEVSHCQNQCELVRSFWNTFNLIKWIYVKIHTLERGMYCLDCREYEHLKDQPPQPYYIWQVITLNVLNDREQELYCCNKLLLCHLSQLHFKTSSEPIIGKNELKIIL